MSRPFRALPATLEAALVRRHAGGRHPLFETAASVALEVPSAVVPAQRNVLLTPRHPLWHEVAVEGPEPFPIDLRLARTP